MFKMKGLFLAFWSLLSWRSCSSLSKLKITLLWWSNVSIVLFRLSRRIVVLSIEKGTQNDGIAGQILLSLNTNRTWIHSLKEYYLSWLKAVKSFDCGRRPSQNCRLWFVKASLKSEITILFLLWKSLVYGSLNANEVNFMWF